jgi:hypothetical protein
MNHFPLVVQQNAAQGSTMLVDSFLGLLAFQQA